MAAGAQDISIGCLRSCNDPPMTARPLALRLPLLWLCACTTMAWAQDRPGPLDATQARVILDSNTPATVYWTPKEDCSAQAPQLARLHPEQGERLRGTAKDVAPGAPHWLHFRTRKPDGLATCDLAGSFTPMGGRNYIAMFRANVETNECMFNLMQQMADGSIEQVPGFQAFQVCEAGPEQGRAPIKSKPVMR